MQGGQSFRRYFVILAGAAAVGAAVAGCATSSPEDQGLTLRPMGHPLPTRVGPLPAGLTTSADSVSCRAASVAGTRPARYSLLVTMQGFLDEPSRSMPVRNITMSVRVHTATGTYTAYLPNEDDISYEPPRVRLQVEPVSEQVGGFGYTGVWVPFPTSVSSKLLLAGRNSDPTYAPATTLTLDEPPTSCEILVNDRYQPGQSVDIPLVP